MNANIDSMPGNGIPPAQIGNVSVITPEVDALVDAIEAGGLLYYVMSGNGILPPFLTFEFHFTKGSAAADAITAATHLTKLFNDDAVVRSAMIAHALSVGSAYHEVGSASFNAGAAA